MKSQPLQTRRPGWKPALITLAGMVLLLLTGWGIYTGIAAVVLSNAVREAKAIGGPVTFDEVLAARRTWPDDQNGAHVILAIKPDLDEMVKSLKKSEKELGDQLPVLGNMRDPEIGRRWSPETIELTAAFLERMRPELAAIDSLAGYKGGRFPLEFEPIPLYTLSKTDHLGTLRTAAKLKHLQSLEQAMRGQTCALADNIEIVLRSARLLADEPFAVSSLVEVAIETLAAHTAQSVCGLAEVGPDQLERMQEMFAGHDTYSRLVYMYRCERADRIAMAGHVRRTGGHKDTPGLWLRSQLLWYQGPVMRAEAKTIRWYNRLILQPDPLALLHESRAVAEEAAEDGWPLTSLFFSPLTRAIELHLRTDGEIRAAETAMAVERYRLARGGWPVRLDQLVPDYIAAIPEDPFNPGRPLRLSVRDDRLIIYSVGENRVDDGGDLREMDSPDFGFILLHPSARNQPPAAEPPIETIAPE